MSEDIPLVDWRPAGCDCDFCRPEPTDPAIRAAARQYSRERIAYLEAKLAESQQPVIDPLFLQAMGRISTLTDEKQQLSKECVRLLSMSEELGRTCEELAGENSKLGTELRVEKEWVGKLQKENQALQAELSSELGLCKECDILASEAIIELRVKNARLQGELKKTCENCFPQEENAKLNEKIKELQADLKIRLGFCEECSKLDNEMTVEFEAECEKLQEQLNTEIAAVLHLDGWLTKRDDEVMRLEASLANRQELIVLLNEQNNGKNKRIKDLEQTVCQQMEVLRHV